MKKTKSRKLTALILSLGLLTGMLSACGGEEPESNAPPSPKNDPVSAAPQGRYTEKQILLPPEFTDCAILQMFREKNSVHLLTAVRQEEKTTFREWLLQGNDFTDVTEDWLASMELPCGDWLDAKLIPDEGGAKYLYAGYVAEGEDSFKGHLFRGNGSAAEEITPEKWTVPNEDLGIYDMIRGLAALDNGTLAALSYASLDLLSSTDGAILESEPAASFYEGGIVTDGENIYLCSLDETGGLIERRKDGRGKDVSTIPYPTKSTGDAAYVIGGAGSLALDALRDGTLIAANENGIFRLEKDAPEGAWEQLADGVETDFSMSDYQCLGLTALEDGGIYALFQTDQEQRINFYEYDPNAVSTVTQELKLFTVYENSLLKQAAALYHKAHPEVLITIENEYPMYYYDSPDYNTVYQKLNTMLLGDNAPDIMVMDHLNMDSYASRGLLADIEDVVKPLEESGELLSNITGAHVGADGKRYVVPLQFSFSMALGRDLAAEDMSSMEALAAFLPQTDYSYMGAMTVDELVDYFYPYFCGRIVDGKQLDKDTLGNYLEYLKSIADNCGILAARPENELSHGIWDLAAGAKLALYEARGFVDLMIPMSMVDYIKGSYTAFEDSFIPSVQMGICAGSRYIDTAKDFLRFALSEQIQDSDYRCGFPVNRLSLEKQAHGDYSEMCASAMIVADDGSYIQFDSKPYSTATAEQLAAVCEKLNTPIREDAKIREVLIECLGGYLDGTQSKEQTIQRIEDGLKMYLAE